jgi:5-methyltetrahydropteroyltriglutamate--homocysteine methyltransferase
MAAAGKPPFRADHVGSLLRPAELLKARDQRKAGQISGHEQRDIEDDAIRDAVKMQEDIGLRGVTDGEFRRLDWLMDFKRQLDGITFHDDQVTKLSLVVETARDVWGSV